jgi:hypothetical protein
VRALAHFDWRARSSEQAVTFVLDQAIAKKEILKA